jgi:hypothetical protein
VVCIRHIQDLNLGPKPSYSVEGFSLSFLVCPESVCTLNRPRILDFRSYMAHTLESFSHLKLFTMFFFTVIPRRSTRTYRRNILSPSSRLKFCPSALKKETVSFSETLVSTYESTGFHYPEEEHNHLHRRENFRTPIWSYNLPNLSQQPLVLFRKQLNAGCCFIYLLSSTSWHVPNYLL